MSSGRRADGSHDARDRSHQQPGAHRGAERAVSAGAEVQRPSGERGQRDSSHAGGSEVQHGVGDQDEPEDRLSGQQAARGHGASCPSGVIGVIVPAMVQARRVGSR